MTLIIWLVTTRNKDSVFVAGLGCEMKSYNEVEVPFVHAI